MRSLIKKKGNDKYIIFRTMDNDIKKRYIIGYYKVGKIFYQETKLFNNNGFVCGFEASETKLLKRGDIIFSDKSIGIGYNVSWHSEKWNSKLNGFLDKIINFGEDSSDLYQKETNNLINLFKDENRIREWKEHCDVCQNNKKCYFYNYNKRYVKKKSNPNMFEVIHAVYNSNLYAKNELDVIKKKYIR